MQKGCQGNTIWNSCVLCNVSFTIVPVNQNKRDCCSVSLMLDQCWTFEGINLVLLWEWNLKEWDALRYAWVCVTYESDGFKLNLAHSFLSPAVRKDLLHPLHVNVTFWGRELLLSKWRYILRMHLKTHWHTKVITWEKNDRNKRLRDRPSSEYFIHLHNLQGDTYSLHFHIHSS